MRVKQEFRICSLSILSQGFYWNAFRSVTSKEQGRRHSSSSGIASTLNLKTLKVMTNKPIKWHV